MTKIDMAALAEAIDHHEMMVASYGRCEEKQRQNAVLEAAGLNPLHSASSLKWDIEQGAKHRRMADTLTAVIAKLEAEMEPA